MARNEKSSRVQKPFPLLKLPAEIRIHIRRYVVVNDVMVLVRNHRRNGRFQDLFATAEIVGVHREGDEHRRSSWLAVALIRVDSTSDPC